MNRSEITEQQISELMQAVPKAEEVDALRAERNEALAEVERLREVLHKTAEYLEIEHPSYIQEMVGNKLLAGTIRKALEGAP